MFPRHRPTLDQVRDGVDQLHQVNLVNCKMSKWHSSSHEKEKAGQFTQKIKDASRLLLVVSATNNSSSLKYFKDSSQ